MKIWPEQQTKFVNITANQSTRNNTRTAQGGIIWIKSLIKIEITLGKAARDQLNPYRQMKWEALYQYIATHIYDYFSLAGIEIQNVLS